MKGKWGKCLPWVVALCLSLALTGPGLGGLAYAKTKLTVWWNKGYYKEEDEGMQKVAAEFAKKNNVDVELTFTIQDDLGPKIISALIARRVPDVAFCFFTDWQIAPKFAWEGKLADVSDLIKELKPRYIESHLKTGWLYNQTAKKWSYYSVPIEAQALGTHYWKDLVQEAGLDPDPKKVPMKWEEHWGFWKKVQDALRKKDPAKYGKVYGIGMTESSRATDTFYNFEQYLLAFRGEVISSEGKVIAGEPKNREAIAKTLTFFTSIYSEGYVPPDALTWTDADNNVNFNNKTVALLGLAFKQRTNDMRDASSLQVVNALLGRGVKSIRAYDPLAVHEAKRFFNPDDNHLFERISYHNSPKEAMTGSDMLFISTDWEEFRGLSRTIEQTVQPPYLVIDGRRMIPDYLELVERGYGYLAVGSPYLHKNGS